MIFCSLATYWKGAFVILQMDAYYLFLFYASTNYAKRDD